MTDLGYQFPLPIQTEAQLHSFVWVATGVYIPNEKICHNHVSPFRAFADAYFARNELSVWKASRGLGGKSFMLAVLGLVECATLKVNVNILGGSGEQSTNVLSYINTIMHEQSLRNFLDTARHSSGKTRTKFIWGNFVRALVASQRAVRGPHPHRLRLDEVDEMDLEIYNAALGQPRNLYDDDKKLMARQHIVASSTHHNSNGTMSEILKRAGEKGHPVYEWCYRENLEPHGWLHAEEVATKRSTMTSVQFDNEIELQEPNPHSRAIAREAVAKMFDKTLGHFRGELFEYIEIEAPQPEGEYVTGVDWAKERDYTIIITFRTNVKPKKLVAFERRGREAWPLMCERVNKRLARYGQRAAHDNTGVGDVANDFLNYAIEAVTMAGRVRTEMLSRYIGAIEAGEYVAPYIEYMEAEYRVAAHSDVFGSGHLPDTISAGAMAHYALGEVDANAWNRSLEQELERLRKLETP